MLYTIVKYNINLTFSKMKNKYSTVTYIDGMHIDYGTGIKVPTRKSKTIMTSGVKRYNNCLHKTASLPASARNLLDYLVQIMNFANEIENSFWVRQGFLDIMRKDCGIKYSKETVNKAFQKLKKVGLLIPFSNKRAVYIVNPLCFSLTTEQTRAKLIRSILNATPDGKYRDTDKSAMGS